MRLPSLDILIVTYNARQKVTACVCSVLRHTRSAPYRLTVLDNASTDGTYEYLKRHFARKVRLIRSENNLGFSGGANLLLEQTRRPWVVLLDDDVQVTTGWIEELYAAALKNPDAGIIGPKVVYPNRRIFAAEFSLMPLGTVGRKEFDKGQRDYVKEVDALPGPCWLMPRKVLEKVGPFDERFFPCQYEDIDYCVRVRMAGYKIIYLGTLKIVHHNLSRSGGPGTSILNEIKFFKKWRGTIQRFPLCHLTPDERLLTQGARLLQKETFCPSSPVLGKVPRLNRLFSESLYRGIAYCALKENKKAVREFHKVSKRLGAASFSGNAETVSIRHLLSIYLARMGMKAESASHVSHMVGSIASFEKAALFLKVDKTKSHSKEIFLDGRRIRILTDDIDYLRVLEKFLPFYRKKASSSPGKGTAPTLEIVLKNKLGKDWKPNPFSEQGLIHHPIPRFGIHHTIDKKNSRILTVINRHKLFKDNWVFHGAFLGPLALLLRLNGASLVHGALLQKNGKGILILGEKGSGKSTLSTACVSGGYRYFSDEHPILELEGSRVWGRSFVNLIALPAVSAKKNFSHLRDQMTWSAGRQKYLLDPSKVWSDRMGEVTEISNIVFPRFRTDVKFAAKRMKRDLFFKRLLEDEYLRILLPNEYSRMKRSVSRRIADVLSRTARGYTIEYGAGDIPRMPALLERL